MTFFLDPNDDLSNVRAASRLPSTFAEGLSAAFNQEYRNANNNMLRERQIKAERKRVVDEAESRLPASLREPPPPPSRYAPKPNREQYILETARKQAASDPDAWKDLDLSDAGIEARVTEMRRKEDADEQAVIDMIPRGGGALQFLAGTAASLADVRNLPFLIAGGGSGSLLRVAGREALLNMAAETVTMGDRFETAEELNKPAPSVTETLALAAAAGAGFGALEFGAIRGIEYYRQRRAAPGARDPGRANAIADAAEDAIRADGDPVAAVAPILTPPEPPPRAPLIPPESRPPVPPTGNALAPLREEMDTLDAEIAAKRKALGPERKSPLLSAIRDSRKGGEDLRIDPDGPLGQSLKAGGLTSKTNIGLFRRGGRKELDNLVADEWEDRFPGITEATGTNRADSQYLDRDGLIDLLLRDAGGDTGWQRRFDGLRGLERQRSEIEAAIATGKVPTAADDFRAGERSESGLFVDLDAYQFDNPEWEAAIEADVDEYLSGMGIDLTRDERGEILTELKQNGGDAEYLIERAAERGADELDAIIREVEDDIPFFESDDAPGANGRSAPGAREQPEPSAGGAGDGEAPPFEPGGDLFPQSAAQTGDAQRQRAEIEARQLQSKIRRLDQARVEDDVDGLFATRQLDIFDDVDGPEATAFIESQMADMQRMVDAGDDLSLEVEADDGRKLTSVSAVLDEIDETRQLMDELKSCMVRAVDVSE